MKKRTSWINIIACIAILSFCSTVFSTIPQKTDDLYVVIDNDLAYENEPSEGDGWIDGFRFYKNNKYIGSGRVKISNEGSDYAPRSVTVALDNNNEYAALGSDYDIAINREFSPIPNDIKKMADTRQFNHLVREILNKQSYTTAEVVIKSAYSLDFEKNGKTQYIILASNGPAWLVSEDDFWAKKTNCQYSIAFLYDGKKTTMIREKYFEKGNEDEHWRSDKMFIYDLNGDGKYEIVILDLGYEGYGYSIFKYNDKVFTRGL